ncbi:MAG: transcription-repair coupling factor [Lactobacillales bacterium]|nr:transcription-repair coupling factor [Lactobacillales bacterium]
MSVFNNLITTLGNDLYGVTDEIKVLYTYNLYKKQGKNIFYVTNTLYQANQIFQSLSCYTNDVLLFPMDDFLTSEALAISPELEMKRIETLTSLVENNPKIIVTNLMGYLRYLPSKQLFKDSFIKINVNSDYNIKELTEKFYNIGYKRETIVTKTGEMAIRGYVVDIFPINANNPIRIEFFGDTVESIRTFNTDDQRTIDKLYEIKINPNSEFIINQTKEDIDRKQKYLNKYIDVYNITNYVDDNYIIFDNYNEIEIEYTRLLQEIEDYNVSLYLDKKTKYMNELEKLPVKNPIYLSNFDNNVNNTQNKNNVEIEPFSKDINEINKRLNKYLKECTVIICLDNRYSLNKLVDNLENKNIVITNEDEIYEDKINLIIKKIRRGFRYNNYIFISEDEIFGKTNKIVTYKTNFKFGKKINNITKLSTGDYVVHNIHGIGRYIGLKTLEQNGMKKDYLLIEYKGDDKLYIPVEKIELISKYSSNEGIIPKLNKLGGSEWAKTKLRVKKKIEDIASKLLELYAKREASIGFSFNKDTEEQAIFDSKFEYEETKDQLKVIEEIKNDMENTYPMDRLLCGDVGYGKTEVAFRAMFKAIMSNKQVAFLCPTTILSNQHFENAINRFSDFAVNIEVLNRFVPSSKVKKILKDLEEGKIDILIGTHRILSDDVKFKDLGLLVIDEEQRFGVKHKEKIKEYKTNIDVLTLSATPIPRTLQMSMAGIRSLSLIETAPCNRYPVQTYVLEENDAIIKDAIYKELSRNGQIFILYNDIENMDLKVEQIKRLIPEARILSAHGRMNKTEIENIMNSFINKEADILLCTTIIETGIDIPNVNTLLILDSDRFGLSQLYQIRGRVGRSNKIAYCYLMYTKGKILSDVAKKRLNVIKEFTELGSGFSIAMRDLSIRGAGDILGSEQAGFIDTVGIELYLNMLNEEVEKLKGNKIIKAEKINEKPLLNIETSIDDTYIDEEELKIEIHKKINTINSYESLYNIKQELEDRFGTLSDKMIIYMHEELFEKMASNLNITNIKQTRNFIEVMLSKEMTNNLDTEKLFMSVSDISRMFRFSMSLGMLKITLDTIKLEKHFIYYLIELLEEVKKSMKSGE